MQDVKSKAAIKTIGKALNLYITPLFYGFYEYSNIINFTKLSFLLIKYNYNLGKFIVLIIFLFSTLFKLNASPA